ncbi:type VII toxin-antitoxin system HepT family RNase toxin [Stutzerimonas zhaodongensis]|jgi:uncharacterized protein YutE (UPF0331/DUF86 family)|uniref:type VII toxin-antitoxin system HepT family RNase toxin n=1 Tax=Stutzerimonas zhaodongensis TaxID=1176257 RepID=UPI001F4E6C0E|nr:DUF86 domain-containing protein [Stutzerimonas zhaodongensis]UNG20554.1 DUF86 domain-containing protein [Stutzerimonas zhaodongensis]
MPCIARIRSKTPEDINELLHDLDLQDVLALNLSRAVQVCVDIAVHILSELKQPPPETMDKAFDMLAEDGFLDVALAQESVGFRNLAVQNYDAINWMIVYTIATKHLADFEAFEKNSDQAIFRWRVTRAHLPNQTHFALNSHGRHRLRFVIRAQSAPG